MGHTSIVNVQQAVHNASPQLRHEVGPRDTCSKFNKAFVIAGQEMDSLFRIPQTRRRSFHLRNRCVSKGGKSSEMSASSACSNSRSVFF